MTILKTMLNADGYSVKGCDIIYPPRGQAGEYSKLATNPYKGCGHKCVYCYVPGVIKMARSEFDRVAIPKPGFLERLRKDARKYQAHGITEQVMIAFTTDPYCPADVEHKLTREVLTVLREYGMAFCTLTKGGARALRDLDLFRPERDTFASTLTTLDPDQSREWEKDAALPADRMATLKQFHDAGIFTWVSLEPVYDTAMTLALIKETAGYVDFYKVGRINYHRITRAIDWRQFTEDVLKVFNDLGKKHYIKKDLQPFLPAGYDNEPTGRRIFNS
jgi:DNA repair photolyase